MNLYSPSLPSLPSSFFSLALRKQQLKYLTSRKVIQKSHSKARPLGSQCQWKVPHLWQLQVVLKEDHCLAPEVLLSEAEKVCSSSCLFPLTLPVATVEIVWGCYRENKGNCLEEFHFTHLGKRRPLASWDCRVTFSWNLFYSAWVRGLHMSDKIILNHPNRTDTCPGRPMTLKIYFLKTELQCFYKL